MRTLKKLMQLSNEWLPGRRVYFLYTHKNGYDRFNNGLKANTEISYHCFKALREAFPRVTFLRFTGEKEERIARIKRDDVVIGHVGETFMKAAKQTQKLISFAPFVGHSDHSSSRGAACVPKEIEMGYYDKAQCCILLTSEYNVREYLNYERNFWYPYFRSKRFRVVHQPVDMTLFERIKWRYDTSNFLYIGNGGHMKGVEQSKELVQAVGRDLTLFGLEQKFDHLSQQQVYTLPQCADFFIQPGMWEAQCVSILEAAARGFIPIVSRETGYPYEHPYLLQYGDHAGNREVLKKLLRTSQEEKKALADDLHSQLLEDRNHNAWNILTKVLVEEVTKLL